MPARRGVQADTLAVSVVILLAATIVQRSVGFGRSVVFCRWLTPEALGEWEMVYSFLMLAAPLAVLGVPGSFGRYAEHYRQRGHLRTFLHRATAWTAACTLAALGLLEWYAAELSQLIFGRTAETTLVRGIGLCMATVILHHTLTALLAAMRLYRIVSAMNFIQSVLFAAIALGLMWRSPDIASIVIGYAVACVVASIAAIVWAWPALVHLEPAPERLAHGQFWIKLLRFAFFVWVSNLLSQLFAVVDRYMLVHCANLSPAEALDQVGHYHSSRVIPLLLVSVAELLSGLIMPHLSHDWEAGRRDHVGRRLATGVKLTSIGMLLSGACILAAAPFLFHVVLQGRYDAGLAVLPWTLAGCIWYGIYCIAQNYLWCAEKTRLATMPLGLGLVANVVLNLILLPHSGLQGAVFATAISTVLCLVTVLVLSRRHGMSVDRGVWLLVLAPVAIGLGTTAAVGACALVLAAAAGTPLVFTAEERRELTGAARDSLAALLPFLQRRRLPAS
ncbi:MAG TPA: oligosaccharide flippase family protein [Lacipirellulaceae bacterium]|nr:oligosaccharide flippase family protein [Lacipirellulaceae bacterium]